MARGDTLGVFQLDSGGMRTLLRLMQPTVARFRFSGTGYHIKTLAEMRTLWDAEVPDACDNTLLIAERTADYGEVFAHRDLMPKFPVPEGETESSWLRQEALAGARHRYGAEPPREVLDRIAYELSVIDDMGFPGYF